MEVKNEKKFKIGNGISCFSTLLINGFSWM